MLGDVVRARQAAGYKSVHIAISVQEMLESLSESILTLKPIFTVALETVGINNSLGKLAFQPINNGYVNIKWIQEKYIFAHTHTHIYI